MIYLDNAATSYPKPERVIKGVVTYFYEVGANPDRAAHSLAREAKAVISRARQSVADLLGVGDPSRIIFTPSATIALNLAFKGLLKSGDHVLTSSMEHNSVLRPLHGLERLGVTYKQIPCSSRGELDPSDIIPLINPRTRLIALLHASNVTGDLMPVAEAGKIAREYDILFLVDAAQTVGKVPVKPTDWNVDILAGPGHKGLLGPMGTGFLYVRQGLELEPLWEGGTGTNSESLQQPDSWPDRFESGTGNAPGLAGLAEGIAEIQEHGLESIARKECRLMELLYDGLSEYAEITLYGSSDRRHSTGTLSFNVQGLDSNEVAHILDTGYDIALRPGLHCAPSAHRTIGTFPRGTVRASVGLYNTEEEIETLIRAIAEIIQFRRNR